eukprot:16916-Heterococcus_DN1.PRE.1
MLRCDCAAVQLQLVMVLSVAVDACACSALQQSNQCRFCAWLPRSQNALILLAVRKCTACTIVLAHRDLYCRTLYAAAARFRVFAWLQQAVIN